MFLQSSFHSRNISFSNHDNIQEWDKLWKLRSGLGSSLQALLGGNMFPRKPPASFQALLCLPQDSLGIVSSRGRRLWRKACWGLLPSHRCVIWDWGLSERNAVPNPVGKIFTNRRGKNLYTEWRNKLAWGIICYWECCNKEMNPSVLWRYCHSGLEYFIFLQDSLNNGKFLICFNYLSVQSAKILFLLNVWLTEILCIFNHNI